MFIMRIKGASGEARISASEGITYLLSHCAPRVHDARAFASRITHRPPRHITHRSASRFLKPSKGGPNPAGQTSGGMGFNTNPTQSNPFSSSPAFTQLNTNPFSTTTPSNPFAPKTSTFTTPGFGASTPSLGSSPFGASSSNPFGSTPSPTPSVFGSTTSASLFGTPSASTFGTSTSIFGTTQAQGATPSFASGLNFGNTQSSPLFQSTTPSLGQTSLPFGQTTSAFGQSAPAFGQSNAFGGNLFSSTPSLLTSSSMGFNQTTVSLREVE
ncbi:hypothetical protein L2E82_47941 [Cichorium intybus]|uniref:Uncharacterized protein n=1 Tax=Cichorium intybus TaxID=13427 RepID=A0ACB8YW25_CICIN|nr:hypothetical protein L2E82_47941 [Cichorium intybus]